MLDVHELRLESARYRRKTLEVIKHAGAGHTSGDLSCIDILNVLYNRVLNVGPDSFGHPDRDRYVQSKGHSVEALYVVLADRGFFHEDELGTIGCFRSHFVGHPTRKVPGIEQNTGALGHGGPGETCAAVLMQEGIRIPFRIVGLPHEYTVTGSQQEIFRHYGISAEGPAETARNLLNT